MLTSELHLIACDYIYVSLTLEYSLVHLPQYVLHFACTYFVLALSGCGDNECNLMLALLQQQWITSVASKLKLRR